MSEWLIEWDRDRIYLVHERCRGTVSAVEQGPGSPLGLDTVLSLAITHEHGCRQ